MTGYATTPSEWDDRYHAADDRHAHPVRRCGRSGIVLPPLAVGGWQNMGGLDPFEHVRDLIRTAFDNGLFHFDYANNYGRPPGSAEDVFGRVFAKDLRRHRGELFVSTKAGYDMWPGPFGVGGSRKYLHASLDDSLRRLQLDHVDLFYSHRYDPNTPLAETAGALSDTVRRGKALYVGISSYPPEKAAVMVDLLAAAGTPCVAYQGSYSMINRRAERAVFDLLSERGVGFVAFSPLNQGVLSEDYAAGRLDGRRIRAESSSLPVRELPDGLVTALRALADIAARQGRNLSSLALQWVLRRPEVTCAVIGVRTREQLLQNLAIRDQSTLDPDVIAEIDIWAQDAGIDIWRLADEP